MSSSSIYDEKIWVRILEKYSDLKALAVELGIENEPEKAREIREKFRKSFGTGKLSKTEQELAMKLSSVEFVEQRFLSMIVAKGSLAHSAGADEDAVGALTLVFEEFEWTFRDFIELCEKKKEDIETISFKRAYEIFLEVIQLKMEYKVPYTKLFIRKLLSMSSDKEADSVEIRNYFVKSEPMMFEEISQELL